MRPMTTTLFPLIALAAFALVACDASAPDDGAMRSPTTPPATDAPVGESGEVLTFTFDIPGMT